MTSVDSSVGVSQNAIYIESMRGVGVGVNITPDELKKLQYDGILDGSLSFDDLNIDKTPVDGEQVLNEYDVSSALDRRFVRRGEVDGGTGGGNEVGDDGVSKNAYQNESGDVGAIKNDDAGAINNEDAGAINNEYAGASSQASANELKGDTDFPWAKKNDKSGSAMLPGGGGASVDYIAHSNGQGVVVDITGASHIIINSSGGGHGPNRAKPSTLDGLNIDAKMADYLGVDIDDLRKCTKVVGANDSGAAIVDLHELSKLSGEKFSSIAIQGRNEFSTTTVRGGEHLTFDGEYGDPQDAANPKDKKKYQTPSGWKGTLVYDDESSKEDRYDAIVRYGNINQVTGKDREDNSLYTMTGGIGENMNGLAIYYR